MSLVTAGPQGTTGYSEGRPRVHTQFAFWPCLIERSRVTPEVRVLPAIEAARQPASKWPSIDVPPATDQGCRIASVPLNEPPQKLFDIAHARSGDKGQHANIGVIARRPELYERVRDEGTIDAVAQFLGISDTSRVKRFEIPALHALNFLVHNLLDDPLRLDSQGKALGQLLLQMPIGEG